MGENYTWNIIIYTVFLMWFQSRDSLYAVLKVSLLTQVNFIQVVFRFMFIYLIHANLYHILNNEKYLPQ